MLRANGVLVAWKNDTSLAMAADCGFSRASCGYVGASDGWQDLKHNFTMDWEFGSALDGNIAVMGRDRPRRTREFTVAIGFGEGHHAALAATMGALATPFEKHLKRFIEQWHRAASPQRAGGQRRRTAARLLQISHNMVLAHEDKTYAGAFIASASIPWGYAKGDDDLGGYHLVWTRDMVQSATALLACGRVDTARRALVYLACTQQPDGGFAQNFWIDGTPYWTGIQLDEVAFPIILAWRLWKLDGLGNFDVFPFVERARGFPGALCAGDAAGALGRECGLFALDAGGGDFGADLRGGAGARRTALPSWRSFLRSRPTGSRAIWKTGR